MTPKETAEIAQAVAGLLLPHFKAHLDELRGAITELREDQVVLARNQPASRSAETTSASAPSAV